MASPPYASHAVLFGQAHIAYELNSRPKWVGIAIRGVLQLLDEPEK